ncbi:MAG: ABC transporter permease subunit [Bdellovibrionales bacterium]|nr:ABC transporter permease subunit [Bdellovibrionales bacterium]
MKVYVIALNTFRELIRSKVLYSVVFFAVLVVSVSALFGSVTIGDQVKVIKDFGLFSISFFGVCFGVISGSNLLSKELNRKTIYNILAKPVHRWEFLLGKELGLIATMTVLVSLMGLGLVGFVYVFTGAPDLLLLQACYCILLELIIVTSVVIFFSSIVVTPLLSGLFSFAVFLAGRSVQYIDQMKTFVGEGSIRSLLEGVYWLLPHLDRLNISSFVVYGHAARSDFLLSALVYALGYSGILLVLASYFFKYRDFN